jgi:hypothetical protein
MLKVVDFAAKKANPNVVAILKSLLEDAEKGDVLSICVVADYDDYIRTESTTSDDVFSTIGHLERLKHVLQRSIDERRT